MKTKKIILGALLLFVIGILIFTFMGFSKGKASSSRTKDSVRLVENVDEGFEAISSGSTDSGDVSVELKPRGIIDGKLEVEISTNTHSVDLSQFDLKLITSLEYGDKSLNPFSAPDLTGHHSNGKLLFNVEEDITSFTIKIKGIPKVEERVFEWK